MHVTSGASILSGKEPSWSYPEPSTKPPDQAPVQCTPDILPNCPNEDFRQSSFFKKWPQLPSPEAVRAQARAQYQAGSAPDQRKTFGPTGPQWSPPPASFESMGLFVKWGANIMIAEGQTLYAIRHLLKESVPVPELYGWRTNGGEIFLSMELVRGQTLEKVWDSLSPDERTKVCLQLHTYISNVRCLRQDPQDPFIGNARPLCTKSSRADLPDDCAIRFTHGDLHPSNIMVSQSEPSRVISIIDWEQSGWMPEYWEARKAHCTAEFKGEWATKYLPMILHQYESTSEAWWWYTSSTGW
ncbi:hypothetical protein AJ78_02929 [Emergomyces pasteurianus Ep9510]|uniref:Aminoglycoside phosphotransferase domain-containing protein n=1 Tax=Emergomyces pasteurianus Ep9510 TaxID=1447872 RepID=A0A1J9Q9M6_9EURO|nr:hypothetical protein AJ78_02929 [Emergomyces pasteurianus Ep9510]